MKINDLMKEIIEKYLKSKNLISVAYFQRKYKISYQCAKVIFDKI